MYIMNLTMDTVMKQGTVISLQQLVKKLVNEYTPLTTGRRSFIINNVLSDIEVDVDETLLAFIVGNLVKAVVNNTEDDCIRIESLVSGSFVMLQIKDNGGYSYGSLADEMRHLQEMAGMIGAYIGVNNGDIKGTTVSLTLMRSYRK
jgi:hypothetical protein